MKRRRSHAPARAKGRSGPLSVPGTIARSSSSWKPTEGGPQVEWKRLQGNGQTLYSLHKLNIWRSFWLATLVGQEGMFMIIGVISCVTGAFFMESLL